MLGKTRDRTIETLANRNRKYSLVWDGLLVGLAAGAAAILYRLALERAEDWLGVVLGWIAGRSWAIAGWFLALLAMALLVARLLRAEPLISGSGIPQVEGEMLGYLDHKWWRVLLCKAVGGWIALFAGLSLGREGPSIQLGAMAGKGIAHGLRRDRTREKYLLTCGASAGLAAAFNAPLAGVMFALEEVHKNFSVAVLVSVMTASVTADILSKYVFGLAPVFSFPVDSLIPLGQYALVLGLGVLAGLLGALYNAATLRSQDLYARIPAAFRLVPPFLLAGLLGLLMPQVLGSGHSMIELLTSGRVALGLALALLGVKFLFSLLSFGSGAPGGIFFPLSVLGAYVGGIYGMLAVRWLGVDEALVNNFIILAMAGYFTAIVRAPITGIILISEMTGSFSHLLSLSVVSIVAYVVADLAKSAPIYESLLQRILLKRNLETRPDEGVKVLVEAVVQHGSSLEGKRVREVHWPESCLLVALRRGGAELLPKGDTVILPSDTLVALVSEAEAPEIRRVLERECTVVGYRH